MMQLMFLLEQVVNGLVLGGYYLLIALGLSLIFANCSAGMPSPASATSMTTPWVVVVEPTVTVEVGGE